MFFCKLVWIEFILLWCFSWILFVWRMLSALVVVPLFSGYSAASLISWELLELLSLPEVARLDWLWTVAPLWPWSCMFEFLLRFQSKLCTFILLLTAKVAVLAGDFFLVSNLYSITLICAFSSRDSISGGLWPFAKAYWTSMAWSCVSYIFPTARFSSIICLGPLLKTQWPSVSHLCSSVPSSNRMGSASKKTFCWF